MSTVMNKLFSPDIMTKSYLMETNSAYLKSGTKSLSFNSNENGTRSSSICSDAPMDPSPAPEWLNGDNSLVDSMVMDHGQTLLSHNVELNMPPIAYMNGNGVRPVRRRHFSQQQTGLAEDDRTLSNENDNDNDHHNENEIRFSHIESETILQQRQQRNEIQERSSIIKQQLTISDYNDLSVCDSYDNNEKLMINRLAKGIEKVLRLAKETRLLNCTELLIPHMLMGHIASDVIELAECEPCGLRGCLLLICIEDTNNNNNNAHNISNNNVKHQNSMNNHGNAPIPLSSTRLLGEFAIDNNVVPTFEVFLTLKRVEPSWFESLENKFFKKTPIILSEVYLLNKKKLYQPSSPAL